MKRILSALLTVAMLVTLLAVPTVTASAAAITGSADLFSDTLPTLYAVKGTPTVDGKMDSAWANAYTLRIDYSHMAANAATKMRMNTYIDIYMMWDQNHLYILEEQQYAKVVYVADQAHFWTNTKHTCSCYLLSLPTAYTSDGVANDGASNMVCVHSGDPSASGVGYVTKQVKYYKDETGATTTVDYVTESKVTTCTARTETGFIMETAISWDALDDYTPNFKATADMILGFGMYYASGWQDNGNYANYTDTAGFQKLKLLGAGAENLTEAPIKPDFSWYDPTVDTYEIWDASDLLGLLELSHLHSSAPLKNALGGNVDTFFKGKTVKIMDNIDLNPGTKFNANGTWTGKTPLVGWTSLADFQGTIDGNGKTISGMYLPNGFNAGTGSEYRYVGLVGRGGSGLVIKDLSLTNGYLHAPSYQVQSKKDLNKDGRVDENDLETRNTSVASFLAVSHHQFGAGTVTLQNFYSNLHLSGTEFSGGIVGSTWFDNELVWDVDNCVFAGTVSGGNEGTLMGRDSAHTEKNSGSINNCYVPVGTTAIATDSASIEEGGNAAYIQATKVRNERFDIRILGLIDEAELGLDSVGMKVTVTYVNSETDPAEVTNYDAKVLDGVIDVYKTVNANGTNVEISTLEGDYDYAYGAVLIGVPAREADTVTLDVVLTRVIDGVAVESVCTYTATYVGGALQ